MFTHCFKKGEYIMPSNREYFSGSSGAYLKLSLKRQNGLFFSLVLIFVDLG